MARFDTIDIEEIDFDEAYPFENASDLEVDRKRTRAMRRIEDWWEERGIDNHLRERASAGHRISKRARKYGSARGH